MCSRFGVHLDFYLKFTRYATFPVSALHCLVSPAVDHLTSNQLYQLLVTNFCVTFPSISSFLQLFVPESVLGADMGQTYKYVDKHVMRPPMVRAAVGTSMLACVS